jgi:hypothetical protein
MPDIPTRRPTLWALLRDCLGATLCAWGARLMTDETKVDLLARLRGAR